MEGIPQMDKGPVLVQAKPLLADRLRSFNHGIKAAEPDLQAWAWTAAEVENVPGRQISGVAPPLKDLLFGVKDIIDVAGMPTKNGCRAYEQAELKQADAACVAMLRDAGAIPIGKTVTAELAYAEPGPTRNPWNTEHTPGGSSSGSAAAVAAGMVPFALGTQTGGSIIRPAAYCGVVGFKASRGAVSLSGVKSISESFDSLGWFTRSVDEAITVGHVLLPNEACSAGATANLKLGVLTQLGPADIDPESIESLSGVAQILSVAGYRIEPARLPIDLEQVHFLHRKIMTHEMYRNFAYERLQFKDKLGKATLSALDEGAAVSTTEYVHCLSRLRQLTVRATDELLKFDAILTYSAPGPAPLGLNRTGNSSCNRVWSALGSPALHLPTGLTHRGLPIGVQLVTTPWNDMRLLEIGLRLHRALNWQPEWPQPLATAAS
ncbi:amidase [Pollutimonas thiosulfatoxidans]|uniref:Amidase domain-containing protein n=1 Tax=Pollutimonas thiosulfatoxidans TaxID=2028345 RepID=A0A410GD14_9BURK|nr:amidase [Pollutimonas thiosulfatoxidans]QAA94206.1 hypothetical protein CKA81_10455 [Pollutimonas thiosulfatoxidans]